jgi:2-deoxy-D-gluconate 3-dehydrogenase
MVGAGITRRNDSLDFTEEDWGTVIDTNLKSMLFLCQAAGRHISAQGRGKIFAVDGGWLVR